MHDLSALICHALFATSVYTRYKHLCYRPQLTMNAAASLFFGGLHLLLHSTMSIKECLKRAVYITPLTRMSIKNHIKEHMVARAPHVQSHQHTFNCLVIQSLTWSYCIIFNINPCFQCKTIAYKLQDLMRLHPQWSL